MAVVPFETPLDALTTRLEYVKRRMNEIRVQQSELTKEINALFSEQCELETAQKTYRKLMEKEK